MNKIILLLLIAVIFVAQCQRVPQSCNQNSQIEYFWDGQHCEYCARNCYCSQFNTCNTCPSSYGRISDTKGTYCAPCNIDKSIQQGIGACCFANNRYEAARATSCLSGYQLFGSVCHQIKDCQIYYEYGACQQCSTGFWLTRDGTCSKCYADNPGNPKPDLCKTCNGDNSCTQCVDGYYLSQYEGKQTIDPDEVKYASYCRLCKNAAGSDTTNCICSPQNKVCDQCATTAYYYLVTEKACKKCDYNCRTCKQRDTSADGQDCQICNSEYALFQDTKQLGACKKCPDNCFDCIYNTTSQKTECKTEGCYEKFYFVASTSTTESSCVSCSSIDPNAIKCDNAKLITQCAQKTTYPYVDLSPDSTAYYLVDTKENTRLCVLNINNCQRMIDRPSVSGIEKGQCVSCYPNWVLVYTNVCKLCQKGAYCLECKAVEKSESLVCARCVTGINKVNYTDNLFNYYLLSGECTQCSEGCLSCTDSANCTQCQYGTFFKEKACVKCPLNCKACSSADKCDQCWDGMRKYVELDKTYCQRCEVGCLRCDNIRKTCELCASGKFLINGQCLDGVSDCAEYNTDGNCQSCKYGFRLVNGRCRICYGSDYMNCDSQCTKYRYVRDGISLSKEFNDKKNSEIDNPPNPNPSGNDGHLIMINLVLLVIGLLTYIG